MVKNKIDIELLLKDKATRELKQFDRQVTTSTRSMEQKFISMASKIGAVVLAVKAMSSAISASVTNASKVEQVNIRLQQLLGSAKEGARAFSEMRRVASQVTQSFEDITEASAALAGVVKGGTDEIVRLMPIILDISASTGIGVQETTAQIIRMYTSGAAAADLFRERGVTAALGLQDGVKRSNTETIDFILKQWDDGSSKFAGANEKLADSFEGTTSQMKDSWFNFTAAVGKLFTGNEVVKEAIESITWSFNRLATALDSVGGDEAKRSIEEISDEIYRLNQAIIQNPLLETGPDSDIGRRLKELSDERIELFKTEVLGIDTVQSKIEGLTTSTTEQQEKIKEFGETLSDQMKKASDDVDRTAAIIEQRLSAAFTRPLSGMIQGTLTAKEALKELGKGLLSVIADYVAELIVSMTIGKALSAVATKLAITQANILQAAWATPAFLASVATGGGAVAAGSAALATGTVASGSFLAGFQALSVLNASKAGAIQGYAEGGVVPATPGGRIVRVAEGGEDEAITPVSKLGGGITINMYDTRVGGDADIANIAEKLAFELEDRLRSGR